MTIKDLAYTFLYSTDTICKVFYDYGPGPKECKYDGFIKDIPFHIADSTVITLKIINNELYIYA